MALPRSPSTRGPLSTSAAVVAALGLTALFPSIMLLPEGVSIRFFFWATPTILALAASGFLLGAMTYKATKDRMSLLGFFVGGGVLSLVIVWCLVLWSGL